MGLMNWHGGLSGSGPLDLATRAQNPIPVDQTLLLPGNVVLNVLLLAVTPVLFYRMAPRRPEACRPISLPEPEPPVPRGEAAFLGRLENSFGFSLVFAALAGLALWAGFERKGLAFVDLYAVPFAFLFAGMLLHSSPMSYVDSIHEAARGCGGIILQFPFYAGIAGIMTGTGLGSEIARGFTALAKETSAFGIPVGAAFAVWTFLAACCINMFIPSGGGQWKVQGAFSVRAGEGLVPPVGENQTCMFIAYGDELTNMLQPFWALPVLAITGLRANEIMGYSAAAMLLVFPIYLACVAVMA
jgi:short-chain fatty acids transporter